MHISLVAEAQKWGLPRKNCYQDKFGTVGCGILCTKTYPKSALRKILGRRLTKPISRGVNKEIFLVAPVAPWGKNQGASSERAKPHFQYDDKNHVFH